MPIAPNKLDVVRQVFAAHPEIDRMQDGVRGQATTLVVKALGGIPWGRKERIKGSGSLSDDALCYRLPDGRFEIYDIISGGDGSATWDYAGTFADGENGFFFVVPVDGPPPPPPPPPADNPLEARVKALEAALAALGTRVDQGEQRDAAQQGQIDALQATTPKKGDPIEVKGSVSIPIFGSRSVISRGTL